MTTVITAWLLLGALTSPPAAGLWAGYQEVEGNRDLPLLGTVKTLARTWFLAEVTPTPDGGFVLTQRPCHVAFKPVLGVQVEMPVSAIPKLPPSVGTFRPEGADFVAPAWITAWDATDIDGDGHPGLTMRVEAPLCGGRLYVASQATTRARARMHNGALEGRVQVEVKQTMLGAQGACLRQFATDETEQVSGWFRLVAVPPETRCPLDPAKWPALPKKRL